MYCSRYKKIFFIFAVTVLLAFVGLNIAPLSSQAASDRLPEVAVKHAWQQVQQVGAYHFTTRILQTTHPAPTLANVGSNSRVETVYLEGDADLHAQSLRLRLWQGGGRVTNVADGVEVSIKGDTAYGRVIGGNWQAMDDFSGSFAPGGDPSAFLAAAKNVRKVSTSAMEANELSSSLITPYAFTLHGPTLANYLRDQLEQHLRETGELPPGLYLDTPDEIGDTVSNGEVWLDSDGLPVRLTIHMEYPQQNNGERVEVNIQTDFSNFGSERVRVTASTRIGRWIYQRLNDIQSAAHDPQSAIPLFLMGLTIMALRYSQSKKVYAAFVIVIILSMVLSPVLQNQQVYAFTQKQAARKAADEQRQQQQEVAQQVQDELYGNHWDAHRTTNNQLPEITVPSMVDNFQPSTIEKQPSLSSNQQSDEPAPDSDDDSDGLTYAQENRLGTDPEEKDTDGDGITDNIEIAGFTYHNQLWYTNPLDPDTDNDGLSDGQECPEQVRQGENSLSPDGKVCRDTDGDGSPDVFDRDDDGDGVPDRVDLSPFSRVDNNDVPFDAENPLLFQLDDLQANQPAFVDFQLRPVNQDHLWYALNVLDWPGGDEQGQIQRQTGNNSTFADITNGEAVSPNSNNGDIRLIPMLEIEIPYKDGHYGNLPVLDSAPITRTKGITLGQWLDTSKLNPYGIVARAKNDDGDLMVYVPLNLVQDETGGDRVAFSGRMFYQPSNADWGNTQKVRLVWLVQMLTDHCKEKPDGISTEEEKTWCDKDENWVHDEIQFVHTYPDDWYLTGLAATEDHGLKVAVAYEDPSQEPSNQARQYDDWLWALAHGLDSSFTTGRDCDTVDQNDKCQGNGQRDINTDDIKLRWDNHTNSGTSDEARWGIPITATQVITFSYDHEGYLAQIAMTETQKILKNIYTPYVDQGSDSPTLLFAVENHQRTTNLDAGDTSTQAGARLTVHLDPEAVPIEVYASLRWAPFRYKDGNWESYPADEYWDRLEIRLKDAFRDEHKDEPDLESILAGQVLIAQSYYLSLYQGSGGLVQRGDIVLTPKNDEQSDKAQVKWLFGTDFNKAGGIMSRNTYSIANLTARAIKATGYQKNPKAFFKAVQQLFKEGKSKGLEKLLLWKKTWGGRLKLFGTAFLALAAVGVIVTAAILAGTHMYKQLTNLILSVSAITAALDTVFTAIKIGKLLYTEGSLGKAMRMAGFRYKLGAAAVGLIIAAAITWGVFAYLASTSGVKFGSMAFDALLAQTIASTITAVIMVAIAAIPIVGQILASLIFLIDSITALVCEATNSKNEFCIGITGYITKGITWAIYSGNLMVKMDDENRLHIKSFDQAMIDPSKGMAVGNSMAISTTVQNQVHLISWGDTDYNWMAGLYWWQYSSDTLASSTFRYHLQDQERSYHEGLTRWGIRGYEWDPENCEPKDGGCSHEQATSTKIPLAQAGINRPASLYLTESYAVPAQECWVIPILYPPFVIPVCYIRTEKGSSNVNLGNDIRYDIFPASLDDFYALVAKDNGYALAWSQGSNPTFPRLKDADGDGLRDTADGGVDPNDQEWDTDNDGLSDSFEVQIGTNPRDPDTDNDGLLDHEEVILGTNPLLADSDYDGLTDKEEVDGWEFVYGFAADGSQLRTWVTSDPLHIDADFDQLTDFQEKTFGFNPRVPSDPHVLSFESYVREEYAPQLLLRLDETGGANTFRDESGYGHNATCAGDTCPAAGHNGHYLNALHFDGVDDFVDANQANSGPESIQKVTLAAWVKLEALPNRVMRFVTLNDEKAVLRYDGSNGPGQLHFYLNIGGILRSIRVNNALQTDTWQYVAGTYDGTTMRLYLNGNEIGNRAVSGALGSGSGVRLSHPTETLDGNLDEVLVFDRALSQGRIQEMMAGRYNTADFIVAPGDSLYYQSTVKNELFNRYAQGLLSTDFPAGFSDIPPEDFVLNPQEKQTLEGQVDIGPTAASGVYSLTQKVDAFITDWREESNYAELLFHFNESSPPFEDSSGSQPPRDGDCSIPHCPTSTTGPHGNALQFDGTDDYIVADKIIEHLSGDDLSFGAWVNPQSGNGVRGAILAFNNRGHGTRHWVIGYDGNNSKFYVFYPDGYLKYVYSDHTFTIDQWHHILVVIDSGKGSLYVNGNEEAVFNTNLRIDKQDQFTIGHQRYSDTPQDPFKGKIDEVVVYNRALSAEEAQEMYGKPVFYLPLDEPAGATTFKDKSGFRHNALARGVHTPTAGEQGIVQNGAGLDGQGYLAVSGDTTLDLSGGNFSLAAWVYPAGGPYVSGCPFRAEYYNFLNPGYQLVLSRCEDRPIDYDWGTGSPGPGVQSDDFWVRWIGDFIFEEGDYTFTTEHDDVVMFELDGKKIIENYDPGTDQATVHITKGKHRLYISYDEYSGTARFSFNWSPEPAYHVQGILGGGDYPTLERINNNEVRMRFNTDSGPIEFTSNADVLQTTRWNHVVVVYNGTTYKLYVNGVDVGEVLPSGDLVSANRFDIGRTSSQSTLKLNQLQIVAMGDPQQVPYLNGGEYVIQYRENGSNWQTLWSGNSLYSGDLKNLNITRDFSGSIELRVFESDAGEYENCSMYGPCYDDPADDLMGTHTFDYTQPSGSGTATFQNTHTYQYHQVHDEVKLTWELLNSSIPLRGKLDEIKIFKYALNADQVSDLYQAGTQVLRLALDDPPGSKEFSDALGGNNAACTGDACPTSGVPGRQSYALRFDGSNDTARIGAANIADLQEMTVVAWVKPLALPGGKTMRFLTLGDEKAVLRYDGANGPGQLHFYMKIDGALHHIRVDNALQLGVWQQVAGTYDGMEMKLYLNGQQVGSSVSITGTVGGGDSLRLSHPTETLDGLLDEVVIYRRALSASQIQTLYQSAPQLLLLLDETEPATTFADATGNGHMAACQGNHCPEAGVKGQLGLAASFDGVNDYIEAPHSSTLMPDQEMTLAVWVKLTDADVDQKIVGKSAIGNGYVLGIQNGQLYPEVWDNSGTRYFAQWGHITAGYWTQLAITWKTNGDLIGYINGQEAGRIAASSNPIRSNTNPLRIGIAPWNASGFPVNGRIDHVTLYTRALSSREVRDLFRLQAKWVEERQSTRITVDSDNPSSRLVSDNTYRPDQETILLVSASDDTSPVTMVELGVSTDGGNAYSWQAAPLCQDANALATGGNGAWCPTFEPTLGEGRYLLQTRATDAVGNVESPSQIYTLLVDDTPPDANTNIPNGQIIPLSRQPGDSWLVTLSGTANDPVLSSGNPGSGAASALVRLYGSEKLTDTLPLAATLIGTDWQVDYPLHIADPTGVYTVEVQTTDKVGNPSMATALVNIGLDATPPEASLDDTGNFTSTITSTLQLTGLISETGVVNSGVAGLQLGFFPAAMTSMSDALGVFHFEEPDGSRRFASDTGDMATCLENSCPSGAVAGVWGNALDFSGGGDYLSADFVSRNVTNTQGLSFGAWLYPDYTGGSDTILAFNDKNGGDRNRISFDDYRYCYYDEQVGQLCTDQHGIGEWFHVMVVIAANGDGTIYFNGNFDLSFHTDVRPDPDGRFSIGQEWDGGITSDFFEGQIDEVTVYNRALSSLEVYSMFGGATLSNSGPGVISATWNYTVAQGIEGLYQILSLPTDVDGNPARRSEWPTWNGAIDTRSPRVEVTAKEEVTYMDVKTTYTCWAQDFDLVRTSEGHPEYNFRCPCQTLAPTATVYTNTYYYETSPWYSTTFTDTNRLFELQATCTVPGPALADSTVYACDTYGHCATDVAAPSQFQILAPLDSYVITPTLHAIITSTLPINLIGKAYARDHLQSVTVLVDGMPIGAPLTWPPVPITTLTQWSVPWTPIPGHHVLASVARDYNGQTQNTYYPVEIYVDLLPPTVDISPLVLTTAQRLSQGRVLLTGHAADSEGLDSVEVQIDGDDWQPASLSGNEWGFDWFLGEEPAGKSYTVKARATDIAGHKTTVTQNVLVDLETPNPITLSLTSNSEVITPGLTLRSIPSILDLSWITSTTRADMLPYEVIWTVNGSIGFEHPVPVSGPFFSQYLAGEAQQIVPSVISRFADGNQQRDVYGPIYVDSPFTPDYIAMETRGGERHPYLGWMDSGCSLIGTDRRVAQNAQGGAALNGQQKLYLTWNTNALRLAWTGANWDYEGDLFIYLDTTLASGAIQALNPYTTTTGTVVKLPSMGSFGADFLIWIENSNTAHYFTWSGSQWVSGGLLTPDKYHFDPGLHDGQTDLYVPMDLLNITSPAITPLAMVAFATEENAMRLWGSMPATNPVNSDNVVDLESYAGNTYTFGLTQFYFWPNLGPGVCPNKPAGIPLYTDSELRFGLSADPAGSTYSFAGDGLFWLQSNLLTTTHPADLSESFAFMDVEHPPVGDGDTISYTLYYANQGGYTATNVIVGVSALFALQLEGSNTQVMTFTLGTISPGQSGSVTFRGQVNLAGTYGVCVSQNPGNPEVCEPYRHWASIRALAYDAAHSLIGNPLDWLWADHRVDSDPPEFLGIQSPERFVNPGENTLSGYAYDPSGVPELTLDTQGASPATCVDSTPDDGQWSCAWNATTANGGTPPGDGQQFDIRLQASDGYGNDSQWTNWGTFLVDAIPPEVSFSTETTLTYSDTVVNGTTLSFSGVVTDNHGLDSVEVCLNGLCNPAGIQSEVTALYTYEDSDAAPINNGTTCGGGEIVRHFVVDQSFTIDEVSLGFNADHARRNDIQAMLGSPQGTWVQVLGPKVGSPYDALNYDVLLNDAFATGLHDTKGDDNPTAPYFERNVRPAHPLQAFRGENAVGTWTLTICDTYPSDYDGVYNRSQLVLKPDNTAARTGYWSFTTGTLEQMDYVTQTLKVYAIDLAGNRTLAPITLDFVVDNVTPSLTAENVIDQALATPDRPPIRVIEGTVSDGGLIVQMYAFVKTPLGNLRSLQIGREGTSWWFDLTPEESGVYTVWINAEDAGGNAAVLGPFTVTITTQLSGYWCYLPLVLQPEYWLYLPMLILDPNPSGP